LALIKQFEGCRLEAYPDPATGGDPWTIGWGRTTGVVKGQKITQAQADAWLLEEYDAFEKKVRAILHVPLSRNQLGALVCLAYNIGIGAFSGSTLLKQINSGFIVEAAEQFARWNKAAGKVMPGLVKRRAAEKALFLKP
jgi:lysozyme